jgi:fructokinase
VILVTGEALIDLVLYADGTVVAKDGGGPYNAARTIARLGEPVRFLAALSTDRFGRGLLQQLRNDGVDLGSIVTTDLPTTLAAAEIDESGSATYQFYRLGTSAPSLTPQAALALVPPKIAAFHVGTLGLVWEPMASASEAVLAGLEPETLVFVDPNCRPKVITDPDEYRARVAKVCRQADIVKVSEEDLDYLRPGIDADDAAREYISQGVRVVLLSAGSEGVRIFTPQGLIVVAAPKVEVVDTIGAGDSLGGAFLAWWTARGLGRAQLSEAGLLQQAAAFAVYVAGRTCAVAGAQPPTLDTLPPRLQAELRG